ncbi:uncharacterized protein [Asterias amurensis]|uniref:uncharacterized protein n=1 Tax=Asterias amurensis TaxID=7602 RepID=UPI003AB494EB
MDKCRPQWVGTPCGQHGPNTFYKGCKFYKNGKWRVLSRGEFFFLKTSETEPLCIAELQLLWQDDKAVSGGLMLSSSKLYFLPEDTPGGRTIRHGENELVSVSGKAIVRLDDLIDWVCTDVRWTRGCNAICEKDIKRDAQSTASDQQQMALFAQNSGMNISDISKEKQIMGYNDDEQDKVIVLNYANYCRFCAALKRVELVQDSWASNPFMRTLGIFTVPHRNTRIMFVKDEFDHPTLGENEKLCDHLAPNMKGRPRKKKLSVQSNSNEDLMGDSSNDGTEHAQVKHELLSAHHLKKLEHKKLQGKYRTKIVNGKVKTEIKRVRPKDEASFLAGLFKFMKDRNSPIERVPNLGFKQIDLFLFYSMGQKFGGYEAITARRLWKKLYDVLGGSVGSTSAATCTRRHYERLILPYERYLHQADFKSHHISHQSKSKDSSEVKSSKSHHSDKEHHSSKHKKKDKQASERPKGMTKAAETWIRDHQKKVAAGVFQQKIMMPLMSQIKQSFEVVPTTHSASMIPGMTHGIQPPPPPPQTTSSSSQLLPAPLSNELVVPKEEPSLMPNLKMKLKLKKSKHKDGKRPKALREQLQELEKQRALRYIEERSQSNPPPVSRKKTRSIADILDHQAKMQAKQQANHPITTAAEQTVPSTSSSTHGNLAPSSSAMSVPYTGQSIYVNTDSGMPLFLTLPQMLPGNNQVVTTMPNPVKTEAEVAKGAQSVGPYPLNSNMATVVHVGQPLQVMQMPTMSSSSSQVKCPDISTSIQCLPRMESLASTASMANTSAAYSYAYNMDIPQSIPTSMTAGMQPVMTTAPQSPCSSVTGMDSSSGRPSVIQHTQQVQPQTSSQASPPFRNAIQPSDLILRNLSHEKGTSVATSSSAHSTVVGQKLSDLPKDAVVVTPRMVSPYMAYIPMPSSMSCGEGSKTDASKDQLNKRKRTESGKENLSRPLSPHGFSVDRTGKVTSLPFAHPVFPPPVPVQEEPCDLSMPKRRRSPVDPIGFRIEAGPHVKHRSSSKRHGESSKERTRKHEEPGSKYHLLNHMEEAFPSLASLPKVKMTPNPRGSIMQGVINPSTLSPSSKPSDHRDSPSRQSTSSNETAPSPHPPPFPYFPHPGMQGVPSDKQPKNHFVFPEFNPHHLSQMMGYPPRLFHPSFMQGPLLTRPELLPTSLPPSMQLTPEQMMRREMFFPPHLPFPMRPSFLSSQPLNMRDGQQPYMHQS